MSESDPKRGKGKGEYDEHDLFAEEDDDSDPYGDKLLKELGLHKEGEEELDVEGEEELDVEGERIEEVQIEKDIEIDELFHLIYHIVSVQEWHDEDLGKFIKNLVTEYFRLPHHKEQYNWMDDPDEKYYRRFFQVNSQYKNYTFQKLKFLKITKEEFLFLLKNFVVAKQRKYVYPKEKKDANFGSVEIYVKLVNYVNRNTGCEIRRVKKKSTTKVYDVFISRPELFAEWIEKADDIRMEYQKVKVKDILVFCEMRWSPHFKNNDSPLIMVHRIMKNSRKRFLYIYPKKIEQDQQFNSEYWMRYQEENALQIWYNNETFPGFLDHTSKSKGKLFIQDQEQEESEFKCKIPPKTKRREKHQLQARCEWPEKDKIETCITCGISSNRLYMCGDCKQIIYCGLYCQKKDWDKTHKYECK